MQKLLDQRIGNNKEKKEEPQKTREKKEESQQSNTVSKNQVKYRKSINF